MVDINDDGATEDQMKSVNIGKYDRVVKIYVRKTTQNTATGKHTEVPQYLGKAYARIETTRPGAEVLEGMGLQSYFQSTLHLRYERNRSSKLTGMCYFVDVTDNDKQYKSDGPVTDVTADKVELAIPIIHAPDEQLPSD